MTSPENLKEDILIIDDNLENINILSNMLKTNGYGVREFLSGKQALRAVNDYPPDLILLDIVMPEMDGYQVCHQIKSSSQTANIPIIFISAKGELLDKLKGFQYGGIDYITKPFFPEEVLSRVKTHLENYQYQRSLAKEIVAQEKIQAELQLANQRLSQLVNIDGLTEIFNRRFFDEAFSREWYRLRREKNTLSLILIDIDYFKNYNDVYGHLLSRKTKLIT